MLLLKNGTIVNSDRKFVSDILIENGLIKQISQNILPTSPDTTVIDVSNKLLLPGGVDSLTNFTFLPQSNGNLSSETTSCLRGGTTTIINRISRENLSQIEEKAIKSGCNYGFVVEICAESTSAASDMEECTKKFGVNCFEVVISSGQSKANLIGILKKSRELRCLLRFRFQNSAVTKAMEDVFVAEGMSTLDAYCRAHTAETDLAEMFEHLALLRHWPHAALMPSVVDAEVADVLARCRATSGCSVITETTSAALATTSASGSGSSLVAHVANGDIEMVASHHNSCHGDTPSNSGASSTRLTSLWQAAVASGHMDECAFVAAVSSNAARLLNLYPSRGRLAVQSVADVVVWDPTKGCVVSVLVGGHVCWNQAGDCAEPQGSRLRMHCNCAVLEERVRRWTAHLQHQQHGDTKSTLRQPLAPVTVDGAFNLTPVSHESPSTAASAVASAGPDNGKSLDINKYNRPPTNSGIRNMQDSSFNFSGAQIDDNQKKKSSIRTNQPPGGKSSIFF